MPTFAEVFRTFDPNRPTTRPWATYCQMRSPLFKMHPARPQALNAVASWSDLAAVYFYDEQRQEWVTAGTKDREKEDCRCTECQRSTIELCGHAHTQYAPWGSRRLDEAKYGQDAFDTGKYVWRRNRGKIATPLEMLYLCQNCLVRNA